MSIIKVVIFWALAGIIAVILSPPQMLLLRILTILIITGFGTAFTALIINELIIPFRKMMKSAGNKGTEEISKIYFTFTLKTAAVFLIIIGGASFINGFLCAVGVNPWTTEKTELPLTNLACSTIDEKGNLYCGLGFYSRIQAYDSKGNFLCGWFINSGGGKLAMKINGKNQLMVANIKGHVLLTFSPDGKTIEEKSIESGTYSEFDKWPAGDERVGLMIEMIRSRIPFYEWLFFGPQCFFMLVAGLLGMGWIDKNLKK